MGFNTAVIIKNDYMHTIQDDKDFGEKLCDSIYYSGWNKTRNLHNSFSTLPSQHADTMQVVLIGGNSIRSLGYSNWNSTDIEILRDLADQFGYKLTKKREKK